MIQTIDFAILDWIQAHMKCDLLDGFFTLITHLGDGGAVWIVLGLTLVCFRSRRRMGVAVLIGLLGGLLIGNLLLKNVIARERPCWINEAVTMLIKMPTGYSFPSGHTLSSVIGATCIMIYNRKIGIPAIMLAALIAFSRLYIYVHFPTDIIGGIILGVGIAFLAVWISRKIPSKILKD